MSRQNRVYADTSVFGGVADEEFSEVTVQFFDEARGGIHVVLLSDITARELRDAPEEIRQFLAEMPEGAFERIEFNEEMAELREAYLTANVIGPRWKDDAAHVAAATVARADLLVSWNFRHSVKWDKIRGFNAANLSLGHPLPTILSPREVIADEKEI